jgi:hypothetical protein
MTNSSSVGLVAVAILIGAIVWAAVPAFPPSPQLLDLPMPSLTAKFGASTAAPAPAIPPGARSAVWTRSRGIAQWRLQAEWLKAPFAPDQPPDSVSQTLYIPWLDASLPRDFVARARVMVPNQRLERP